MNAVIASSGPPPPHTPGIGPLAQIADPSVSRAKFQEELARFRAGEALQRQRGVLLLRAEFPEVVLAFAAPQVAHAPMVFGARLDFTDYDHHPPSLRLVNPFTEEVYLAGAVPTPLAHRLVTTDANGVVSVEVQALVQAHEGHPPFVCMRGVREYHEHPAHTGDSWVHYRGTGRGTLADLVDQLHAHGIAPLKGFQVDFVGFQMVLPLATELLPGDPLPVPPAPQGRTE